MNTKFYCDGMHVVSLTQNYFHDYDWLMIWTSYLGDPRYCLLIYFPFFFCINKSLGLKILWTSSVTEWLNAILKWCFRDDRPYWWESDACVFESLRQFPITCETGPGFPSGHVMGTTSFILTLILHLCDWSTKNRNEQLFNLVLTAFAFIFTIMVAISRLFIAAHFLHQVIVGAVCGVVCSLLINTYLSKRNESLLIRPYSVIASFCSLLIALSVYYSLLMLDLNPNSTIEKAKIHCNSEDWLHIDTTLFHSIVRSAAAPAGVGVFGYLLNRYENKIKKIDFFKCDEPIWFRLVTALFICQVVVHAESYEIPKEKENIFYMLTFCKFFILPLYVIALKNISELLRQFILWKKCKCN